MTRERQVGGWAALALPGVPALLAVASVARLHVGGLGLALLLLVEQDRDSLASAGLAVGALSLGIGATRPLQGWLIDRRGVRCFAPIALVHVLMTALMLAAVRTGAGTALLVAGAFLLGLSVPSISVAVQAILSARVTSRGRPAAIGADVALQDAAFMLGPLLAGAVAAVASPAMALVVLLAIGWAGAAWMAWCAGMARLPGTRPGRRAPLRPILRPLATAVSLGVVYGGLAVGAVAAALERGHPELAGPVTAIVFVGGLLGDVVIAPRHPDRSLRRRLGRRTLALLILTAALVATPGTVLLLIVLLAVGAVLGGVWVTLLVDVAARAAPGGRAEAFGWAGATLRLGNAVGAAVAGLVAEWGDGRAALLVAAGGAALACATVVASRRSVATRSIETHTVSVHAGIGVAASGSPRLPEAHETTPHPDRTLCDVRSTAGAGLRGRRDAPPGSPAPLH